MKETSTRLTQRCFMNQEHLVQLSTRTSTNIQISMKKSISLHYMSKNVHFDFLLFAICSGYYLYAGNWRLKSSDNRYTILFTLNDSERKNKLSITFLLGFKRNIISQLQQPFSQSTIFSNKLYLSLFGNFMTVEPRDLLMLSLNFLVRLNLNKNHNVLKNRFHFFIAKISETTGKLIINQLKMTPQPRSSSVKNEKKEILIIDDFKLGRHTKAKFLQLKKCPKNTCKLSNITGWSSRQIRNCKICNV